MSCKNYLLFILLLLISLPSYAVSLHDPSLSWQTLESDHFLIHYHDDEQTIADKLVNIAEQHHIQLSQQLNWQPRSKTHIVLTDRYDFSNGWATPLPVNHITLINRPPSEMNSLEDYDDWLELVFIHEYIHILQLDMAERAPAALRRIFGRFPLLFPHIFQPTWALEGLATHYETDIAQGVGRGQSALYRGIMALEVKHGLLPLSKMNGYPSEWPAGATPYLYGVYFYQFLMERYGQEKVSLWLKQYSGQIIPFMVNTNLKRTFGKDMAALYREFEEYLKQRFAHDLAIREQITTTAISENGHHSGYGQLLENGDLYYIQDSLYRQSQLMRLRSGEHQAEMVSEIHGNQFDVDTELGILMTQYEISNNSNFFKEIYLLEPGESHPQALTHQGRYQYAIWDKNQQQILAIHYQLGRFALHRLDRQGQLLEKLWQGDIDTVLSSIALSPDGKQLVAAIKYPSTSWELAQFENDSQNWLTLTQNRSTELQPRFSPDGQSLLFTADYSGYYEVYQLNLHNRQLLQLTRGFGASYPSINASGDQLYFNQLSENGWDLHHQRPLAIAASLPESSATEPRSSEQSSVAYQQHSYQPLHHIMPSWWFPFLMADRNLLMAGASTSGSDPLYRHQYQLAVAFDNVTTEPNGYLLYRYDRWRTGVQLMARRSNSYYFDTNDEVIAARSNDEFILSTETPLLYRDSQWALHGGVVLDRDSTTYLAPGYISTMAKKRSNTLAGVGLSYNNSEYFRRSISPIDGRTLNFVAEKNRISGGAYQGYVRRFEWHEYLRLGDASVAALKFHRGWGEENTPSFELGGHSALNVTQPGAGLNFPPFNRFEFPLRGYPKDTNSLTGQSMQLLSAELRLPLLRLEKTAMVPPVGLQQLHAALFYDVGNAWDEGEKSDRKRGTGIELHHDLLLGYRMPLTLTLGAAKGIDDGGEQQYYLRVQGTF